MSNNRDQGGNRGGNNKNYPPNPALARGGTAQPGRDNSQNQEQNPLQAMNREEFKIDKKGKEIASSVLTRAVEIEQQSCVQLYTTLTQRTKSLAKNGETISAKFSWRLRVGGVRGFREILLPVFHPVYGIPYIPASSLKGAVRAWARQHCDIVEVDRLLGYINNKLSSIGCVQFLDAFPIKPCLSIDIANPQWHWQNDFSIKYKPEPHAVLSTEKPEILIGLTATTKGNINDVRTVKKWLEAALAEGIGSRKILKAELSIEPIRADSVTFLQTENRILHLEFQTTIKSKTPLALRMLDYYVRLTRKYQVPVTQVVIFR